jgi:hypothetical protein
MGKGIVYVLLVEDEKGPGGALASDWAVRAKQTVRRPQNLALERCNAVTRVAGGIDGVDLAVTPTHRTREIQ